MYSKIMYRISRMMYSSISKRLKNILSSVKVVKHPSRRMGWAGEAIRLVTGEPTRATARLAYPSSGNGAFEGH